MSYLVLINIAHKCLLIIVVFIVVMVDHNMLNLIYRRSYQLFRGSVTNMLRRADKKRSAVDPSDQQREDEEDEEGGGRNPQKDTLQRVRGTISLDEKKKRRKAEKAKKKMKKKSRPESSVRQQTPVSGSDSE